MENADDSARGAGEPGGSGRNVGELDHESAADGGDGDGRDEAISSDEESSDGEGQYCLDLDDDRLNQLTSNDPDLTALEVCFGGSYFDASDVDWEIEGDYIAENTHCCVSRLLCCVSPGAR